MDSGLGGQVVGQLKQVGEAVSKDVVKGLAGVVKDTTVNAVETLATAGMAPTSQGGGVAGEEQTGGSSGNMAQMIAQKDAQDLARARQKLANFNATLEQKYRQVRQEDEQTKQIRAQEEHEDKVEESEKKRAQDLALQQAKRGGGGEGQSREVK